MNHCDITIGGELDQFLMKRVGDRINQKVVVIWFFKKPYAPSFTSFVFCAQRGRGLTNLAPFHLP